MADPGKFDEEAFRDLHAIRIHTEQLSALEDELREGVRRLRYRFVPWEDIAAELQVSRQAAQQRYGRYCR